MAKVNIMRALVSERLTAAAEEIFALVERTIVEYEEELCRCKEENQRKQQLLDSLLSRGDGAKNLPDDQNEPHVKQELCAFASHINEELEEQRLKQEEELLPEFTAASVKNEEQSSLLEQSPYKELAQSEFCGGAEPEVNLDLQGRLHSETEEQTDDDVSWGQTAQMETETDGDNYSQDHSKYIRSYPDTSDMAGAHLSGCATGSTSKFNLKMHSQSYTEEKIHCCPLCQKTFTQKSSMNKHLKTHTGERPHSCSLCNKTFAQKGNLNAHMKTHTGEKPFSCFFCTKTFALQSALDRHLLIHTGERPHSCSVCMQTFVQATHLKKHMRTHTGERPYSCSICEKTFAQKEALNVHMKSHRDKL